ncbi:hypothetical protein E2C01_095219 [Portunus trituberculatus]|uniref:Uncharacterized protein n=1 Tax=Portunus trituberculatus TaxID=210409 RepID=A0A5B7JUP7_PORTR|nr:hypothetical protein [Portunus trituberculatus]
MRHDHMTQETAVSVKPKTGLQSNSPRFQFSSLSTRLTYTNSDHSVYQGMYKEKVVVWVKIWRTATVLPSVRSDHFQRKRFQD